MSAQSLVQAYKIRQFDHYWLFIKWMD